MKVALLLRPDADVRPGGDVVQARAVIRYLREHGAEVVEFQGWQPPLTGVDLAVVMNLTVPEQAWLHARACRRAAVPYLLLPVFWDLASAIPSEHRPTGSALLPVGSRRRSAAQRVRLTARDGAAVVAAAGARLAWYATAADAALVQEVVSGAELVCPNSRAELEHLARFVGTSPDGRWFVLHNGLWASDLPPVEEAAAAARDDVVVSVGAVSPRKNTLGLVRAARQLDCRVLVVGQQPRVGDTYAERVMSEVPDNVEFIGLLPRAEVLRLLGRSRVHVQPGFVETPGLASLEALALGTPVVVSDTVPVREYFSSDGVYADPHDPDALAAAISQARDLGPQRTAAERIRREFDWSCALHPLGTRMGLTA